MPVGYVHVVFTLPPTLSRLALQNRRVVYDLLFGASAATLLTVHATRNVWGPHVHCVVPAGGLAPNRARWVHARASFFLPVKVLSRVFRGKFVAGLADAFRDGTLAFPGDLHPLADEAAFRAFLRSLFRQRWVVYAKPPFGGPAHVLHYLAQYTHRVAISNHRIVNVADGAVTCQWKDYGHGNQVRTTTVSADEFLRRFFLHVLPRGFVRIRFFGFLASRRRARDLADCRHALASGPCQTLPPPTAVKTAPPMSWPCPRCGAAMIIIDRLTANQIYARAILERIFVDTS